MMQVIGLTGSIGMGKSTIASIFTSLSVPVLDSDMCVHRLLAPGGAAVQYVARQFPDVVIPKKRTIDRQKPGDIVFADLHARERLEAILHPLVRAEQDKFLLKCRKMDQALAVLDIPLLFETGAQQRMDAVICASAPFFIQAQRVLSRPGMTRERFEAILATQMDDVDKQRLSDYVIRPSKGRAAIMQDLKAIVREIGHARDCA
jgi:dephospho-CoA kinase